MPTNARSVRYALLYEIRLPNDVASLAVVEGVLAHLAARFDTDDATIASSGGQAPSLTS